MCTDSATAHDALDEALELSVHTGGGPDQELVDVESHQQQSTTLDVMETSEEEKTKKYHTTPTEATQNPVFMHPAIGIINTKSLPTHKNVPPDVSSKCINR